MPTYHTRFLVGLAGAAHFIAFIGVTTVGVRWHAPGLLDTGAVLAATGVLGMCAAEIAILFAAAGVAP